MELNRQSVSDLAAKLGTSSEVITTYLSQGETPTEEVTAFQASLPALEVFTTNEFQTRLTNERNQALQGQEGKIKGSVLGDVDKTVYADTQIKREDNEATQDYIKRAYGEKIKVSGGQVDQQVNTLRQQLSDKEVALQAALQEVDTVKADFSQKLTQAQVDTQLGRAIDVLPIQAKEELLGAQKDFLRYQFNQMYDVKTVEGKPVAYSKQTGQPVTDPRTASYVPLGDIVKQMAPKYVALKEEQKQPQGSGYTSKPIDSSQAGADFSQYETVDQLKDHLNKSGIPLISEKGQSTIEAYLKSKQPMPAVTT